MKHCFGLVGICGKPRLVQGDLSELKSTCILLFEVLLYIGIAATSCFVTGS